MEGSIVVQKVKGESDNVGLDASTGEYVDMIKAGIIDPTKVARTALQNAASISGLMLTTETLITEIPDDFGKGGMPGGGPPGGGMGGMGGMY